MRTINQILNGTKVAYINGAYALAPSRRISKFSSYLVYLEYVIVQYDKDKEPEIVTNKQFVIRPWFEVVKVYNGHDAWWKHHIMTADFFLTHAEEIMNDLKDCYLCGFKITDEVIYPLLNTLGWYNLPKTLPVKGIIDIAKVQAHSRSLYSRMKLTLRAIYNTYYRFEWDAELATLKVDNHGIIYPHLYRRVFEQQVITMNHTIRHNIEWFNALSNKNKNKIDPDGLFVFSVRGEPTMKVGKYAGTLMRDIPADYWDFLERPTLQDDTLRIIRDAKQGIYPVASDYKNF